MTVKPSHIAVDWGTSRFRAYLAGAGGAVADRRVSNEGISTVAPGGFPAVLERHCGGWLASSPALPVIMAGMVGSRNGWAEAPYAPCPASAASLAQRLLPLPCSIAQSVTIIPGLMTRDADGVADVMRGEETLLVGAGMQNGIAILPGTHSKWAQIIDGRITGFRSFMTGEFYGLLLRHSLLGRLSAEPHDRRGYLRGLASAARGARLGLALTHLAFEARTAVLAGDLPGEAVAPFLSGLLIGAEVQSGHAVFGKPRNVLLIGGEALTALYQEALELAGVTVRLQDSEACLLAGIDAVLAAGKSLL